MYNLADSCPLDRSYQQKCSYKLEVFCDIEPITSKVQELSSKDSKERMPGMIPILKKINLKKNKQANNLGL